MDKDKIILEQYVGNVTLGEYIQDVKRYFGRGDSSDGQNHNVSDGRSSGSVNEKCESGDD